MRVKKEIGEIVKRENSMKTLITEKEVFKMPQIALLFSLPIWQSITGLMRYKDYSKPRTTLFWISVQFLRIV